MPARIDAELDLHGYTAASARDQLEGIWSRGVWKGLRRVRVIHGTGVVLYKTVRLWADKRSIPWTLEEHNPGVTILQPSLRREESDTPRNRPFSRYRDALAAATQKGPTEANRPTDRSAVPDSGASDLFAEELERLDRQDARSVHRRKHGL